MAKSQLTRKESIIMKKKILSALLAATMVFSLAGCTSEGGDAEVTTAPAGEETEATTEAEGSDENTFELALITDVGTIDDKSFNQGSWEGLAQYAEENNITHKYYQPSEKSDDAYTTSIDLAVAGGAKVIVTPGFLFEASLYDAQTKYPDVNFIGIDVAPGKDGTYETAENVMPIFYAEEQAGYLAGYAAVVEGYRSLGFMGGIAVPAVVRFGYGYIQGIDAAAKDLGLAAGDISIKYTYLGDFSATPENQAKAAAWYNEGVEVIFACAGGAGSSVMKAAETAGTKVIGVDVDQSAESATVITSAMKSLKTSVYNAITAYYDGTFVGGASQVLGAADDGIELPMSTSTFEVFTQEDYDRLYAGLADGSITVQNDSVGASASDVPVELVTVEVIS